MTDTSETDRGETGARRSMSMRADLDAWFVREVLPLEAALTQYIRHNWRDGTNVADLLQDIYLRVFEAAAKEYPKATKPFVFAIAHNLLVDRVRREKVIPLEAVENLDSLGVATDAPGPEAHVAAREELRKVQAAVNRFPPRAREAFTLYHVEGLSVREIGVRMGITDRGVTWHLNEGLRQLANILYGDAPERKGEP
jgi:RNA polymerase sigma factor (sigma-70 family)